MCFSEPLTHENGAAHQGRRGWVYIGWKSVIQLAHDLFIPQQTIADVAVFDREFIAACRRDECQRAWVLPKEALINRMFGFDESKELITHFPPRQIVRDNGHGLHVAASIESCAAAFKLNVRRQRRAVANPISAERMLYASEPCLVDDGMRIVEHIVVDRPYALCRVLVPQACVRPDHHVTALMLIPPNERETEEDIARCDELNVGLCEPQAQKVNVLA